MAKQATGNRPVFSLSVFPLSVAVWRTPTGYSIRLEKLTRNPTSGKYERSEWLWGSELLQAADLLNRAHAWIISDSAKTQLNWRVAMTPPPGLDSPAPPEITPGVEPF